MMKNMTAPICILLTLAILYAGPGAAGAPEAARRQDGFINVDSDLRLYYQSYGDGGDVLVLVHGGPGANFMGVGPDLLPLADQNRLVMYDQRGGGRSDRDPDVAARTINTHVNDLEAVRRHLGVERMTLIGHSWGSVLAAVYAANHPNRVERMILIGPMEPTRALFERRLAAEAAVTQDAEEELARLGQETELIADPVALCRAKMEIIQGFYYHDRSKMALKKGDYCDAPPDAEEVAVVIERVILESLGQYDLRSQLADLDMPVLVVEGAQTPLPLEGEQEWVRSLPNARLWLIDRVGHAYPFVEAPDVFFPGVQRFLEGGWPQDAISVPR